MIELTWGDIKSPVFIGVLQRMIASKMPFEVTVKLLALAKRINDELTLCGVTGEKIEKDYAGNPLELEAELKKLFSHKFQTRISPIPSAKLQSLELNVNELLAIRSILEDKELFSDIEPQPVRDTKINDEPKNEVEQHP